LERGGSSAVGRGRGGRPHTTAGAPAPHTPVAIRQEMDLVQLRMWMQF